MSEDGKREIRILINEELYKSLERKALELGFKDVSSYIIEVLSRELFSRTERTGVEELERMRSRLEKFIQDEINKGLTPLENMRRQLAELIQRVDELEEKIKSIEGKEGAKPGETHGEGKVSKPYKTGIERLREDKIVFESMLPARIQRDRLFSYFERMGAVVLHLSKERIAVDSDFWREFKEKLFKEAKTNTEEDLKKILGEKGYLLWKALYEDNMILYDSKTRSWKPVSDEVRK
ncbi:MAG: CopG family transcriptional regulator [Desulfurococcus sp.]|jgi:hypothetical protein|uniref:CopG family transcriptional regulator n=1 Tax=Desulfurococcus sp. TaxID=51678 RepID=UPI00316113C1